MKHPSISKLIVPLRNFKQKMMKEETFDYSKVPHNFGLCATDTCPYTDTCLRRIAYTYAPSNNIFLYVLNPKAIESTAGKCKYYCSNKKVRYAKGFIHTAEAISVGQSGTFRYRLIGLWGIRRYYQKRKGKLCSHQPSSNKSLQLPVT